VKTFLLALLLSAMGSSAVCAQGSDDSSVDQILVIINDQILTGSMVEDIAVRIMNSNADVTIEEAGPEALNIAIRRILYRESFLRLGLDESMLDPQVEARIQALILEDGSRQRFLDKVKRDGYHSIEDFQKALRHQFIEGTVAGIVSGTIPSPNDGKRAISDPSPAQIRAAYQDNEIYRQRPAEFEWAALKFLNDPATAPAADRAAETLSRLGKHTMSIPEALAKADSVSLFTEIRAGAKENLKNFLETAAPGDCMELTNSVSGVLQLVLVTKRSPSREFSFQEAQLLILNDLRMEAQNSSVRAELSAMYLSSYSWFSPELRGLRENLDGVFGEKPDQESF
jgi:hypothetical protein